MKKSNNYEPYKVLLVGLDLTDMDEQVIRYAALISRILPVERIFFVHVAKTLELPESLLKEYPHVLEPLDEQLEADIRASVKKHFDVRDIDMNYVVHEGNPIEEILKLSKIKEVDLILMGRKKSLQGSGIVSSKIARKCPCSLLLVTQGFSPVINNVLVPVDFSEYASLAVQKAFDVCNTAKSKLSTTHIYHVPSGFYKTGKTYQEFADIMKHHAEAEYIRFLADNDLSADIPCEYIIHDDGKQAALIYDYAKENDIDLIMLGSKGRTSASSMLIGSLAEKLTYLDGDIPVWIVKKKGENMGFFEAMGEV